MDPTTMQEMHEALTTGWESSALDPFTRERVTIHALIPALREAVFGGMESTGGAGGFSAKMPIDSGALDLYEAIDGEIAEAWAAAFPGQIPGVDAMERLLSQFVAVTSGNPDDERVVVTVSAQRVDDRGTSSEKWWVERSAREFTARELLSRWVKQIREFFNPPRRREILSPCVECGEEWGWRLDAGEAKPFRALVFEQDDRGNTLRARCMVCGAFWGLLEMQELASKIADLAKSRELENVGG